MNRHELFEKPVRHPRTLEEAFGPYQRHGLVQTEKAKPFTLKHLMVYLGILFLILLVVHFGFWFFGG
jgi:hypothetical protein